MKPKNAPLKAVPRKTLASHGTPRVNYANASGATKKWMKATVKTLVKTVVDQCNEISKGDSWKLLQEVTVKMPSQEDCQNKISKVMDGLSQTYQKEEHSSSSKIRVLSTLAPHFKNKELKKAIPCSDYELTEARKHAQQHGPGATANKLKQVRRFRIPPEDLAFVVNFIHHPDNTCRSSHRMANCKGKRSSWISDLFDQEQQPVMWLKDGKATCTENTRTSVSSQAINRYRSLNFVTV